MTKPISLLTKQLNEFIKSDGGRRKKRILQLLKIAEARQRSGFEKWLQFELALFFNEIGIATENCKIEHRIPNDEKQILVDLFLTIEGAKSIAIELKVRRKPDHARKVLKDDLKKLANIRFKEENVTGIAVVLCKGEFERAERTAIKREISESLSSELPELEAISAGGEFSFLLAELPKN